MVSRLRTTNSLLKKIQTFNSGIQGQPDSFDVELQMTISKVMVPSKKEPFFRINSIRFRWSMNQLS